MAARRDTRRSDSVSASRRSRFGLALMFAGTVSAATLAAQNPQVIVGRNSNMLGGEQILRLNPFEVRGDVLGRADNEPSCTISTRNPNHIICGANTYRMVDVPGVHATSETRDAWQGVYQSTNGGDTWESTLHPGFFLDPKPHVLQSHGFRAAADATLRSGPAGMAWYSGIAFRQDKSVNSLFVSTFADLNNRENDPMPFKFVRTVLVDLQRAPKFLDKPWIFVEAAPAGQLCTVVVRTDEDGTTPLSASSSWRRLAGRWLTNRWPGWSPRNPVVQHVPASIIHVVYSLFQNPGTGSEAGAEPPQADLMYSRSTNCGLTFSRPKKLSAVSEPANGGAIAKAPVTGSAQVFTAWRRVKLDATTSPNAILAAVSNDNGGSWSAPNVVAEICPFDQGTTPNSFRTTAFPTMVVDPGGRAYVAWADRGRLASDPNKCDPHGAARISISTSSDGVNWTEPQVAVPSGTGEHQIMPSLAFTAGKLFLAWVDFKEDASQVFGQYIDEANLFSGNPPAAVNPPARRHTADVRVAMADPGSPSNFGADAARVSRYLMGRTPSIAPSTPGQPVQLQWNAWNRRWARKTTVPFAGDYIDIATRSYLPPDPTANPPRPDWTPNNGQIPTTPTVLIAWTDNRDMRDLAPTQLNPDGSVPFAVPLDKLGVLELGSGASIVDPTQQRAVCTPFADVFKTGTTNQNIYAARAALGFAAGSPSGNKALGLVPRSFVVYVRNDTDVAKTFRLVIANQPPGGIASFDQFNPDLTTVEPIFIARHSSIARTVFVSKDATSTPLDPEATVRVDVIELVGGVEAAKESIYLNGDSSAPEIDSPEIDSREIYLPEIDSPEIDSHGVLGPEIDSPEIDSPEIDSETLKALGLQAPEIDSPEIDSPEIDSPEIDSPEIDSPEIDSAPIIDVKFKVTNTGNTTAQYNAKSFVKGATAGAYNYQIIVRRRYDLRAVGPDCFPTTVPVSKVLVNLLNVNPQAPEIDSPEIDSPEIDSSTPNTATFFLAPGEEGEVIVRARKLKLDVPDLTVEDVGVATQQKAVDTDDVAQGITEAPVITSFLSVSTTALPLGVTGTPYSRQLEASGGIPPYTWSMTAGALPPGLTLSSSGLISGTPTTVGSFEFTVEVRDSDDPQQIATRTLSITITQAGTASLAFVTQPTDTVFGQPISPQVSARAINANGTFAAGISITMALGSNPGGGTLSGTLTAVTGSNGIAVFPTLTINNTGQGYTLVASAFGFPAATSVAFDITASLSSGITVYDDRIAFLAATAATSATGPLPSLGSVNGGATIGSVTFGLAPGGDTLDIGGSIDWYPALAGNEIALGFENLQVSFASPVTAMGFVFVEPNLSMPVYGGTPVDSTYLVTLYNGTVEVGSFSFNAPDDQVVFVGVSSGTPFTSARIVDTTGSDDDEYFGEFYTSSGGGVAYIVTNTADGGAGSLRQAIVDANATSSADSIIFNIPGEGPYSIGLVTPLPGVVAAGGPIHIDGTTQPGYTGAPIVGLDGNAAGVAANGLTLSAGSSLVRGLQIGGFDGYGILLETGGGNRIFGNYIGTNLSGDEPFAIGLDAVRIQDSPNNIIGGTATTPGGPCTGDCNVIVARANNTSAVLINGNGVTSGGNQVLGNFIGTNAAGDVGLGGPASFGVFVFNAPNAAIGDGTAAGRNLISGNNTGIHVSAFLTSIKGNYIGTNAAGTAAIVNGFGGYNNINFGVQVTGGNHTIEANVLSGNGTGVSVVAMETTVRGNFIGLNAAGTAAVPNFYGVLMANNSHDNIVGGTTPGQRNVISGNTQHGVYVTLDVNTTANRIIGNYIGTNPAGNAAIANGGSGVVLDGVPGNFIGGTAAGEGNLISGNTGQGVRIEGSLATNNLIAGNYIGTNAAGTAALGNVGGGVFVGAANNTIGGLTGTPGTGLGNVISGNPSDGIAIGGTGPLFGITGTTIQGNIIGLDAGGSVDLGNANTGVRISAAAVQVGGAAAGARNVISGNQFGISLSNSGSTFNTFIEGNYIGTDISGTLDRGNSVGILVGSAPGTRVGGTAAGAGNLISGNQTGISIFAISHPVIDGTYNALVQGNVIGLDVTGTVALGNGTSIGVTNANNLIGGTAAGARNLISGNAQNGIVMNTAAASGNVVQGNYVGTDASGTLDRGNGSNGVHLINAPVNMIGGSTTGAGNLISGNQGEGVRIDGASATGNVIQGNSIGTNAPQTGPLGNSGSGVYIRRAPGNSVISNTVMHNLGFGGVAICGNVGGFCGGGDSGTQTSNGDGNAVHANFINNNVGIGVSLDGVANTLVGTGGGNNISSNGNNGVLIFGVGADFNQIASNAINSNTGDGVHIVGAGNTANRVQSNSFINNTDLAIDLGGDGVTANDTGDADSGPNNLQNFPVITAAETTEVEGTLNSTPNTTFSIQLYESIAACNASGQGETLVATFDVTTDGTGNVQFGQSGLALTAGRYVMATATDPLGNTSEFSACISVSLGTERVSVASDGTQGNGVSNSTATVNALSATGRFVALESTATNLVDGDVSAASDVFLRDTCIGASAGCVPSTILVSVANDGTQSNGWSDISAISADGRFLAFRSFGTLVAGDGNGVADIFLRDTCVGAAAVCTPSTTRVSVASDGSEANAASHWTSVSANGRYIAFASEAGNLVAGDTNGVSDIFVRDTCAGAVGCTPSTIRVSVASAGTEANSASSFPAMSATGRFVAFQTFASNLVAGDTNAFLDVFLRDTCIGAVGCTPSTIRVSVASDGTQGNSTSEDAALSADGRFVVFDSAANNLVAGDTNGTFDSFVRDTCIGASAECTPSTIRVSLATDGTQGNADSFRESISGGGRFVAFDSVASNLVAGDTNSVSDVFVRDTCIGASAGCVPSTIRLSVGAGGLEANGSSEGSRISANAEFVVFASAANNLVSGDTNGFSDAFVARTGFFATDGQPPDLIVEALTHEPANPTTADTITFTAVVKNAGLGPAAASTLMFKIGGETPGAEQTIFAVPALAAGATHTVQRQLMLSVPQGYINTATADYTVVVAESDETNNTTTDSYVVTSP